MQTWVQIKPNLRSIHNIDLSSISLPDPINLSYNNLWNLLLVLHNL